MGIISIVDAIFLVLWLQLHVAVALNLCGDVVIHMFFFCIFIKVIITKYLNL